MSFGCCCADILNNKASEDIQAPYKTFSCTCFRSVVVSQLTHMLTRWRVEATTRTEHTISQRELITLKFTRHTIHVGIQKAIFYLAPVQYALHNSTSGSDIEIENRQEKKRYAYAYRLE